MSQPRSVAMATFLLTTIMITTAAPVIKSSNKFYNYEAIMKNEYLSESISPDTPSELIDVLSDTMPAMEPVEEPLGSQTCGSDAEKVEPGNYVGDIENNEEQGLTFMGLLRKSM